MALDEEHIPKKELAQEDEILTVNLWIRLVNYILDQIIIGAFYSIAIDGLAKINIIIPMEVAILKNGQFQFSALGMGFVYGFTFLYYVIMENIRGQTFGKMITGTMVVNRYDEKPSITEIFLRTLCRLIPLEGFSFIPTGIGWHDRFSQTYVRFSNVEKKSIWNL